MHRLFLPALCLSLCLLLSPAVCAAGETMQVPDVILKGAEAYMQLGPEQGFKTWFEGSPLRVGVNEKSLAGKVQAMVKNYGKCLGFGIIRVQDLTPRSSVVYFEMDYQGGPLFMSMLAYNTGTRWIVSGDKLQIGRDPAIVLP